MELYKSSGFYIISIMLGPSYYKQMKIILYNNNIKFSLNYLS